MSKQLLCLFAKRKQNENKYSSPYNRCHCCCSPDLETPKYKVWNTAAAEPFVRRFLGHSDHVKRCIFAGVRGEAVLSCGSDGTVRVGGSSIKTIITMLWGNNYRQNIDAHILGTKRNKNRYNEINHFMLFLNIRDSVDVSYKFGTIPPPFHPSTPIYSFHSEM